MGIFQPTQPLTKLCILQPYLVRKFKISDTCGVNNLHGMPAIFGGLLSVLIAGIATPEQYDQFNIDRDDLDKSSLHEIFPQDGWKGGWTAGKQAIMQLAAMVVTLVIAVVGGLITGLSAFVYTSSHPCLLYLFPSLFLLSTFASFYSFA